MAILKCLPILVMPLGVSFLLLLFALCRRPSIPVVVPVILLGVSGTPFFSNALMYTLEDRYAHRNPNECPYADAVFVFGGMLGPRGHSGSGPEWNEASERFTQALAIYRAKKSPLIVLSGGPQLYEGGPTEGEVLKAYALENWHIPEDAMYVTRETLTTEAEADILCRISQSRSWRRVLLVTSAYHMSRVMQLSVTCTAERIPVPVAFLTPAPRSSWVFQRPEYYLPQAKALAVSERALHEYLGSLLYFTTHQGTAEGREPPL